MELKKLDKKARTLWLIECILAVLLIAISTFLVVAFASDNLKLVIGLAVGIPAGLLSVFLIMNTAANIRKSVRKMI